MNVIRWILSNIILILFVLALTYAYVYWDNLTGEETPAGQVIAWMSDEFDSVREFVEDLQGDGAGTPAPTPAEADASPSESTEEKTGESADTEEPSAAEKFARAEAARSVSQPVPAPQETTKEATASKQAGGPDSASPGEPASADAGEESVQRASSGQQLAQAEPQSRAPATRQQPADSSASESSQRSADGGRAGGAAATKQASPGASEESQPSVREQWINARKEYRDGDYQASIRNYLNVIERSEDNYDAWGELGNVYYRQRNYEKAAEAYFNAAEILVNLGEVRRASTLRPILSRLDREKSRKLQELLQSSR